MRNGIDIGGIYYTIMEVDDVFDADGAHFGQVDYKNATIKICRDMTPDVKEATLYHEITHAILTHIGEYEKSNDETFVQNFSIIMQEEDNKLSVVGFYFGEPDEEATKTYAGSLTAEFETVTEE